MMAGAGRLPPPRPLLLAARGHACLAWWHAPPPPVDDAHPPDLPAGWLADGPLPLAVVLASSWGEEDISGYDGLRGLAVALAQAGLGTLRFEWPDAGDSSASCGAASVEDLLAALDAAAARALELSGCRRLAFAGLRLGALLAAHAAAARPDAPWVVGLLPVASGRVFVREQRLLGAGLGRPDAGDGAPVMLGGFEMPAAQAAALAALEWPAQAGAGLVEALLLSPSDVPHPPAAAALARLGVRVDEWRHHDLSNTLAIAHQAGLARAAIGEVVRWLQERAGRPGAADVADELVEPGAPGAPRPPAGRAEDAPWMHLALPEGAVRERVVLLGADDDADAPVLAGVLSEPTADAPPRGARRGIVLLSSGRERRIGPHRLWVPFARQRAARGDVVLRLDIAGVGDSAPRSRPDPDGVPELYDPRCVDDVARAVAWLRRERGVGPCTVMGLCSGAHHAWRVALAGVDVQQVVAINPLVFHWKRGASLDPLKSPFGHIDIVAHAGRSLLLPERWRKLLTGRANLGVIAGAFAARARHALRLRLRELARTLRWPLRDDLASELARTCARGVALDFVFSRHEPGLVLLREESGRRGMRLRRDRFIKVCEVDHADHTFAGTAGRAGLYARLDSLLPPLPVMNPALSPESSRERAARPSAEVAR